MVRRSDWIVIPAYNEASALAGTLWSVRSKFENVVVVDDCSVDDTAGIASRHGAHVCRHPINLGQGAAIQTGFDYALREGAGRLVTFDADGQHSVSDAVEMLELLEKGGYDVVLGSRFLGKTEGMTYIRRIFLRLATFYTRRSTKLDITDTHNGLRVFSRQAALRIRIRQNRMAHATEILEQIAQFKLNYVEAPCTITYTIYSLAKGQRMSGAFAILLDLYIRRLYR